MNINICVLHGLQFSGGSTRGHNHNNSNDNSDNSNGAKQQQQQQNHHSPVLDDIVDVGHQLLQLLQAVVHLKLYRGPIRNNRVDTHVVFIEKFVPSGPCRRLFQRVRSVPFKTALRKSSSTALKSQAGSYPLVLHSFGSLPSNLNPKSQEWYRCAHKRRQQHRPGFRKNK